MAIESAWSVGGLIMDICQRAGIPYDRVNVDFIEGYCDGIASTNKHTAGSLLDTLGQVFMFDPACFDGQVNFIPRGGDSIADITINDLVDDGEEIEEFSKGDPIDVPKVMHLEYMDTNGGLTQNKQTSDRSLDERALSESSIQSPVIMDATQAMQTVIIGHKLSIEEQRGAVKFSLSDNFLYLTQTDVVTYLGKRVRIQKCDTDDGFQVYEAVHDRQSAYSTTIQGIQPQSPAPPPELVVSPSVMHMLDIPIIDTTDDLFGYYIAVSSETMDWKGAIVEFSRDGGANWVDSDGTETNCVMGEVTTGCGVHPGHYRDDLNELVIELLREDMELIVATQAEMQNRVNLIVVGNELMNFSTCEQLTPTSWRIGGFLRGRRGTTISTHIAGERFILLDRGDITFVQSELFDLGRDLTFRAVSYGASTGDEHTYTYNGISQRERAPAYLKAIRDGSDLHVSWQGVGRIGGGSEIRMGQYFTGFRITLGSGTWDTTESQITIPYSAGTLSVAQVNSMVGVGPTTSISV